MPDGGQTKALKDVKALYSRLGTNADFSTPQLVACIQKGVGRFSVAYGRENRLANVQIVAGQNYIKLPSDYMYANMVDLAYGIAGIEVNSGQIFSTLENHNRLDFEIWEGYDTALGATAFKPPYWADYKQPIIMRLSTDDEGDWILQFSEDFTSNKAIKFFYTAFHQVCDADEEADPPVTSKYTIPKMFRYIFMDCVLGELMLARARDTEVDDPKKAASYREEAKVYFESLEDVKSLGTTGDED